MMVAVHESGYPRVDVAATALRGRACCSRPISLVSTRPRMQARRLAIPVELGMTTISPASEGAQKRFLGAWFSHVSEFSVTDA